MNLLRLWVWCGLFGLAAAVHAEQATITFLQGQADILTDGSKQAAKLGASVGTGASVATKRDTRVEIKFEDGTMVRLGPNSSLHIKEVNADAATREKKTVARADKGHVWLNVAKSEGWKHEFTIATPAAVAAVKGTVFRADADAAQTQVNVYDGTVELFDSQGGLIAKLGPNEMVPKGGKKAFPFTERDDKRDDKDGWISWNKSRDKIRVMFLAYAFRDRIPAPFGAANVETYILDRLSKEYVFQLIDKDQLEKIKEDAKIKAALQGKNDKAIQAAGLELGTDVVISLYLEYSKGVPVIAGSNLVTTTANLISKFVRADTGEIIGTSRAASDRGTPGITDEASAWKSIEPRMEEVSTKMIQSIKTKWERDQQKGASIDVVVTGADFAGANLFQDKAAKLDGVESVQKLYFVVDRSLFTLKTKMDTGSLAEKFGELALPGYEIRVVGMSLSKVELDLKKIP